MEWQPIETAPRDKTWVLLWGGMVCEDDYHHDVGEEGLRRVVSAFFDPEDFYAEEGEGSWMTAYWDGAWRTYYERPTHWMPLPKPPLASGDDVG